jgi:DNA gyrase/topoisomerase IV subunit B
MNDEFNPDSLDIVGSATRALVLYSLAEFQAGHATMIRVTAQGRSFSVGDNGRGHAIHRLVAGSSYLKFVYTHLDYPFDTVDAAPVQLQGIGISLINLLCSELSVVIQKQDVTVDLLFRNGNAASHDVRQVSSSETGNIVSGSIRPVIAVSEVDVKALERWLRGVLVASQGLTIFFQGQRLDR